MSTRRPYPSAKPPEHPLSQEHMQTLDHYLSQFLVLAPQYTLALTADHGMNRKTRCWDLHRVLSREGVAPRFVLSPERDNYIVHHRNFTGCSWIWLERPEDEPAVTAILRNLQGVEEILTRERESTVSS